MKTFWIALVFLAVPGFRPALAYEDLFPRQPGPDKNQSKQPGLQGKEDSRTRQRGQQRGQANSQTRPWEVRPWEQQNATDAIKQQKAVDERRRVGRKARKEQLEQKNERVEESGYQDGATQHRNKWKRHQMESERYNPDGFYQR